MSRAYLVFNPAAGRFPSSVLVERASKVLREAGWDLHQVEAQSGPHITQLAHQAGEEGQDAFFVIGGDGSMNLAVAGLMGSETALGVLPAGTANVWAQELGLTRLNIVRNVSIEECARRLATAQSYPVDVGLCNDRPFLLWAGVGLDAYIVHRIEPREPWEKQFAVLQYSLSALWNAGFWKGMDLRVELDGQLISGRFLLAVVSNVHLYAGGITEISPGARLDDGKMDLWLFRGETFGDTLQIALELWARRHAESNKVIYVPCRQLVLESDTPLYVQVDGEPAEEAQRVSIEICPKSLRVLIPPQAPFALIADNPTERP
jgi:diacylglycerol kinase (ATP)